jgi:ABC-2 type transport system ATP-binding protein
LDPALTAEGLVFRYGNRLALDGVSLQIAPGAIVGLLGSNGAGKSTLLRILCGLLTPESGAARVNGWILPGFRRQAQRSVGFVAQHFGLYADLHVEENLHFYARAYGLDRGTAGRRVEELLGRFQLAPRRGERAGALSHGWQQRLGLAAALVHRPPVLLLDEATAGLDPEARRHVWDILEEEAGRGAAVLLSTHHLDEAARCASVAWLREGRVAGWGPYSELSPSMDGCWSGKAANV